MREFSGRLERLEIISGKGFFPESSGKLEIFFSKLGLRYFPDVRKIEIFLWEIFFRKLERLKYFSGKSDY
ncbi:unnamed protein product [Meloidogyne enterolobii]|uniref:Uncharacterized protein n=1 Tax=Meloidogyne enterolobii TaxID=390850 RepID=A0ACB1AZK5_MELEN